MESDTPRFYEPYEIMRIALRYLHANESCYNGMPEVKYTGNEQEILNFVKACYDYIEKTD